MGGVIKLLEKRGITDFRSMALHQGRFAVVTETHQRSVKGYPRHRAGDNAKNSGSGFSTLGAQVARFRTMTSIDAKTN